MSKAPALEPRWLVGLLSQWALRGLHSQAHSLGWYTESPMLSDGIRVRVRSYEPTGYGVQDFADLECALRALPVMRCLAVVRYAAPWKAAEIDLEWHRSADTWLRDLKLALGQLDRELTRKTVYS